MSEPQKYEKQEKEEKDEKEVEKQEEKTMEEKWRRDPLGALIWALILIWAGGVWLAWNLEVLQRYAFLRPFLADGGDFQPPIWRLILLGVGILIGIEIIIRLLVPNYRRSIVGSLILAVILIGIGLGDIVHWGIIWPVLIIAVGIILMLQGLLRKR